ncbi:antibiotic biosynthesis monooxygenase family protein [Kutzneria sp. NPDC052558]|uniref:antibiotic biosynthesis monooxygenase family protein n=1 Tax=Kutzneria sp. NPDC052558 TaxID=3364121 RepID=UPI0037C87A6C
MAVVKINALDVPEGAGEEIEKRFAARAETMNSVPGFLGFELLRPVGGESRYFVYTRWESDEAFQAWSAGPGGGGAPPRPPPPPPPPRGHQRGVGVARKRGPQHARRPRG